MYANFSEEASYLKCVQYHIDVNVDIMFVLDHMTCLVSCDRYRYI